MVRAAGNSSSRTGLSRSPGRQRFSSSHHRQTAAGAPRLQWAGGARRLLRAGGLGQGPLVCGWGGAQFMSVCFEVVLTQPQPGPIGRVWPPQLVPKGATPGPFPSQAPGPEAAGRPLRPNCGGLALSESTWPVSMAAKDARSTQSVNRPERPFICTSGRRKMLRVSLTIAFLASTASAFMPVSLAPSRLSASFSALSSKKMGLRGGSSIKMAEVRCSFFKFLITVLEILSPHRLLLT